MSKCKITVVKRLFNKDLIDDYCSLNLPPQCTGCPKKREGQVFYVENHNEVPEGFCSWAWADIQRDVTTVMFGGSFPWIKEKGMAIACCTDGLMPVVFKIEKVEE